MLQFPTTAPPRADSLSARSITPSPSELLKDVKSEVEDAQKMLKNEEFDEQQLKQVLVRMISRVQELSTQLAAAFRGQSELETQLTLAKSNLQLSLANTEMLEEALKRDFPDQGKDVGWRRWSSREGQRRSEEQARECVSPSPGFVSNGPRADSIPNGVANCPQPTAQLHSQRPNIPTSLSSPPPTTTPESRFFKFRLRGASPSLSTSQTRSAVNSPVNVNGNASHLTSASLPSLVLPQEQEAAKREAELNEQLEEQRRKYESLAGEKANLEAELESLSQALFEEANKMVATERIKFAEADDELRSTIEEREALKSALKLIEEENDRLRHSISEGAGQASSEDNTRTTLSSVNSHEAKATESDGNSHPQESGTQVNSRSLQEAPKEEHDLEMPTLEHLRLTGSDGKVESEEMAPVLAEAPVITQASAQRRPPSPVQNQNKSQNSEIENSWSTFFRKDSNQGLVTYMS